MPEWEPVELALSPLSKGVIQLVLVSGTSGTRLQISEVGHCPSSPDTSEWA